MIDDERSAALLADRAANQSSSRSRTSRLRRSLLRCRRKAP